MNLQYKQGLRYHITRRDYRFGAGAIYWYSTVFDLLTRPTNAVDSISIVRTYLYNRRSELAAAQIGTNSYGYAYDTIGNRMSDTFNGMSRSYAANCLNQYSSISTLRASAPPREINPSYDADGNLVRDDRFAYAYDAENRMLSARPIAPSEGDLAVVNTYDHKHRRVMKRVERFAGGEWMEHATHTFVYDGCNIVLEQITFADGLTRIYEYFWGNDLSGTEQGAGGVGGLVAVSVDGYFFIPCYDHNGNIVCYVSESGTLAAQYVYDPYGSIIEAVGPGADLFSFGFSTKYHDREVDLVGYQYRHLSPPLGRWLNRDPIEDEGGENLYVFCCNSPQWYFDVQGHLPSLGWGTVVAPNGRFNDALGDFLDGGSSKTYLYVYPDSASTRLLGHPELQRVMSEFRAVKCGVSRDIPGSVNFKAGVLQFIRDAWTYFGVYDFVGRLNPINAQAQDIGYEILGSFKGQYNISLDCANCSRTLYMTIENSITVASGTRIPGTKYSLMTYPLLNLNSAVG